MIYRILFLLLTIPSLAKAQSKNLFDIWLEKDQYRHALHVITLSAGKIADSCAPMFPAGTKMFYILRAPYLKDMPDTLNGFTIKYINADSNSRALYDEQQKTGVPIFYFSKMFNYLENYNFWIMPVHMKKKKPEFEKRAYKMHYFFEHYTAKYTYTKADCESWE